MANELSVLALPEVNPDINLLDLHGEDSANNETKSVCNIKLIKVPRLTPME